ncbi:Ig-like domain-containing protein, partial [Methanobrevibacter sp. OttesenSCG-928-I08]|nr:Ig-like domain-containing protein [Methanobrevibacter sp. OttesenSCG-928-I08]
LKDLAAGTYNVTVTYNGDNNYNSSSNSTTFTVNKASSSVNVTVDDIVYGDDAIVNVTVTPGATGNVSIVVDGGSPIVVNINELPKILKDLTAGYHNVTVTYNGDRNYNSNTSNTITFNVKKANSKVNVTIDDVNYGENATINVNLPDDATGTVTIIVDGGSPITIDVNQLPYELSNLSPGSHTVNVTYNGDSNYNSSSSSTTFIVTNTRDVILNASDIIMVYKDGTRYVVVLTDSQGNPLSGQAITITVNGVTYNRITNETGEASLGLNLFPGNYLITTVFNGTDDYDKKSITTNLTIITTLKTNDLVKYYRNSSQFEVQVFDSKGNPLENAKVYFNVHGRLYTKYTDNQGKTSLSINLHPGNYVITTTLETGLSVSNNITVKTVLIGSDLNKTYSENKSYEVKLLDGKGNPLKGQIIHINIHGILYNKITDEYGIARLDINLDPDSYIITATYNDYSTSNIIRVY